MEELQENEWMEMRHELQENGWDETEELCYLTHYFEFVDALFCVFCKRIVVAKNLCGSVEACCAVGGRVHHTRAQLLSAASK